MTNYDCKTRPATHATPTLLLYTHTHGDMHMHMHLCMWREGHRTLTLCAHQTRNYAHAPRLTNLSRSARLDGAIRLSNTPVRHATPSLNTCDRAHTHMPLMQMALTSTSTSQHCARNDTGATSSKLTHSHTHQAISCNGSQ